MYQRLDKAEALRRLAQEAELSAEYGHCSMCRLAAAPSTAETDQKIFDNSHGVVVLDGYGYMPGHLLVICKRHVERTSDLQRDEYDALSELVWQATHVLQEALSPLRIYSATLGSSESLPMTFAHYHTHVVPLADGGEAARPAKVFSWSSGVVSYSAAQARDLVTRLRRAHQQLY